MNLLSNSINYLKLAIISLLILLNTRQVLSGVYSAYVKTAKATIYADPHLKVIIGYLKEKTPLKVYGQLDKKNSVGIIILSDKKVYIKVSHLHIVKKY